MPKHSVCHTQTEAKAHLPACKVGKCGDQTSVSRCYDQVQEEGDDRICDFHYIIDGYHVYEVQLLLYCKVRLSEDISVELRQTITRHSIGMVSLADCFE